VSQSSNAGSVLDVFGRANSGPPFLAVAAKVFARAGFIHRRASSDREVAIDWNDESPYGPRRTSAIVSGRFHANQGKQRKGSSCSLTF
jgi:hypothetical protein